MRCTVVFSGSNITSADATAISTFIVTTLSASYTMEFLEINNSGHVLAKIK